MQQKQERLCSLQAIENWVFPEDSSNKFRQSTINNHALGGIRIVSFIYMTAIYFYNFTTDTSLLTNFIYLTLFGYFITWLAFAAAAQSYLMQGRLDRWGEVLLEVAWCFQWVITILYWAILYKGGESGLELWGNINVHGLPLAFLVIQFAFSSCRFLPSHFIIVQCFTWTYLLICSLPYALRVDPVYGRFLNWKNWLSYVLILVSILIQGLFFIFGRLIFRYCKSKKTVTTNLDETLNQAKPQTEQVIPVG